MSSGRVVLVGAGPGDPELITLKGLRWLRRADVVVYDQLIGLGLLDEAPPGARRIFAGKAAGRHYLEQSAINSILIHHAEAGALVVRLKGGDPFVLGRGGEEVLACARAGVPVEVVPGVSSAIAVPAAAGIPVTHRGLASSFAVVTGHEDPAKPGAAADWGRLATAVDTLVILMGVGTLPRIAARLVSAGRSVDTPAAVIHRGTTEAEETVTGTLGELASRAAEFQAPAVIVIGQVVAFRALANLPAGQAGLVQRAHENEVSTLLSRLASGSSLLA
ncbi:MAG TPA: uroporphyrinogen-III C-methyltransferase [Candidatus Bathyarchaeia archaeon]|nr:uroporphyrinogen-III C-methyltransferase [Candidatus Bathyarchaeia archaeon]